MRHYSLLVNLIINKSYATSTKALILLSNIIF